MKRFIYQILISILSGILGAFLYQYAIQDKLPTPKKAKLISLPYGNFSESEQGQNTTVLSENSDELFASSFAEASQVGRQSIVYIRSIEKERYNRYSWFDLFFNKNMPREERRSIGSGSGVIFSSDGYIITNAHVIADADEIEVVHKKQRYQAELVGKNLATDLALIKIKAKGLPKIVIGSSQKLRVGDWVIAIGNPFNLNSTVTAGIVSAKGRRINILKDVFPIESFIQTDAAINPGNSGGGLLNKKGELVGINTAILSQTGSYSGYGFAVPSDIVVKVFKDLKAYGEIQKAFLGCEVKEIDSDVAQRLNIDTLQGVAVISLIKEGAAYKSNVELGDVILQINDYQINSQADYDEILSISSPGDTVTLTVRKQNGSTQIKYPILTNSEGTTELGLNKNYKSKYLGGTLAPLPRLEQVQLEVNGGVKVKEVQDGILKNMELEEGFIIMSINGYTVNSPQEFEKIVKEIYGTVVVELIDKNGQRNRYRFRFN